MRLSTVKKIIIEDFPSEQRKWLPKLTLPLNTFLDQAYKALIKGITIRDNLKAEITSLTLLAGETSRKIKWGLNEKPSVCILGNIVYDNGEVPTTQITMYWVYANGQIEVTFLGLDANSKYKITILGMV